MFLHTKPPAGTQINPLHPLSRGLIGCWMMNEGGGSIVNDISGNKNHGRLTNMAPNTQGSGWGGSQFGGGLQFDGSDDFVDCGDILLDTEKITIMMWIKLSTAGIYHDVMSKEWAASPTVSDHTWLWFIRNTNITEFYITESDGSTTMCAMDTNVGSDVWYHFAATYDKQNIKVYLDGMLENTVPHTQNMVISTDGLMFNGQKYSGTYYRRFDGTLDSVYIYNRALSADEVKTLYHNPFCNMMVKRPSGLYVPSAAGLSIPVAMHYYNQLAVA